MASKTDAWTLYTVWSLFGLPPLSRKGGTATILQMVGAHLEAVGAKTALEENLIQEILSRRANTVEDNRRWMYWASKSSEAHAQAWVFINEYQDWLGRERENDQATGRPD